MIVAFSVAWREVKTIVLGLISVALLAILTQKRWLTLLSTLLLGWVVYFFRDPERVPTSLASDLILAPADGRVISIELVNEPHFFQGSARCISIFLSIFDVHVQRSPYTGVVKFLRYQSGSFAPAFLKDVQDNESNLIGLETAQGLIAIKQVAGLIARRIICWTDLEDELTTGQRFGLIKFGSRVDLFLPLEVEVLAHVGQQLYAGQTVVARWDC